MAKKQKSKARLDKYYYLAKDHGFRSRATFKLIQLNKKYNFFSNATVCIDLCAAPGGWLQAASKFMPMSSIKVGVDLVPIKAIPGCSTIVSDITTQECRMKLEKEIKHMKADIVLNDGAPNVGGNWAHDAYTQSELVLFALKLASEFLKVGGWFVTKVFRSSDYSSLLYVMQQLFRKVEATKPLASRQVSAEIFVVCHGFLGGDIDPKLLDPKYALKQLEDEEDMKMNSIKSIKALLEASTKRHRSGYYSDSLYKQREFAEFVESPNPYQYFYETNKIVCETDKSKQYLEVTKKPNDWENIFLDLKVLGKSELATLLNWREKIRGKALKKKKKQLDDTKPKEDLPIDKEEYKKKKLAEMDEEIHKIERSKKKKLELNEKKKEKNELRQKISFIKETNDNNNNDGTEFDQELFNYLKDNKINIEDIDYKAPRERNDDSDDEPKVDEIELSEYSSEEYYEMMNEYVEDNMKKYREEKDDLAAKRLEQKLNRKGKKLKKNFDEDVSDIEENKVEKIKEGEEEESENKASDKDDSDGESSEQYNEDDLDDDSEDDDEEEVIPEVTNKKAAIKSKMSEIEKPVKEKKSKLKSDEPQIIELSQDTFVNPLKKKKTETVPKKVEVEPSKKKIVMDKEFSDEGNDSSDTENDNKESYDFLKKKRKIKGENIEKANIDFVQRNNDDDEDSEFDIDDKAEIRAIAKKMLRKKDRLAILNSSYNRYAFDDECDAPDWFMDDEKQHNKATKPVTKEEILAERELLKQINDRLPKKVLEAKNRKKKKMARQMEKIKKKAQVISNQEEIGEGSKIRQIEKLYRRELGKNKQEKKYVVVRSKQKVGRNSRSVKYVDKRLKKDKRSLKRAERRNKTKKTDKNKKSQAKKVKGGGKKNKK